MPVKPRDAATVIVARPTDDGSYEVLLTRRPASMAFMGGTYVFPGGALDDADSDDRMAARSVLDRDGAADKLGEGVDPAVALGLLCCGLREVYEEVGILLAVEEGDRPVNPARVREQFAPNHAEQADDPTVFAGFLESEGLRLSTDLLTPHGRLVTPEQAPIRFDARFFVAPFPEGQAVFPHPTEVVDWLWIRPGTAIEQSRSKELDIPIPTLAILQGLAEIPGYEQILGGATKPREIEAEQLSELVHVVRSPNPGLMTGGGTNTYIVGRGEVAIIDPAVPDPVYIERVAREAGNRGNAVIVLVTHKHIDHIGGVVPLVEQMPTPVGAYEMLGEPPFVTRTITDGEVIEVGGATLRAIHTPGHASDHLCFYMEQEQALFAGDVVAGFGTVVISPPDGDLGHYMDTLETLNALDLKRIYAGHGPVIEDGHGKLTEYITHRKERERQVIEAMRAGDTDIKDMVKRIYVDTPETLHPMAERSVLAQLEVLERNGSAARDGDNWSLTK